MMDASKKIGSMGELGFLSYFSLITAFFRYAIPLIPASISFWIISASDRLFISNILGLEFLAIYFIANRICQAISFYLTPFSSVYTYQLSRNVHSKFYFGLSIFAVICCVTGGILIFLTQYLGVWLQLSELSIHELDRVMWALALSFIMFNCISALNVKRAVEMKQNRIALEWIFMAIVNLLCNFYFIGEFGLVGAALSSIAAFSLGMLLILINEREQVRKIWLLIANV